MDALRAQLIQMQRRTTRNSIVIPVGIVGTLLATVMAFGAMRDRLQTQGAQIVEVKNENAELRRDYIKFSLDMVDRLGRIETLLKGLK